MKQHPFLAFIGIVLTGTILNAYAESTPKSGSEFIKAETLAMQQDELENAGYLTVDQGRTLFHHTTSNTASCASCHGENGAKFSLENITHYPILSKDEKSVIRLQDQIKQCRETRSKQNPLLTNSSELIALETYVRHLAKGQSVKVKTDGAMQPLLKQGETIFRTRYGLIDMSCAHCHETYTNQMIRGQRISQGMGNGFPAYRLDIGEITNLDQRIQQCLRLMRAEPFEADSQEIKLLGAYIMARSNGLKIETPAVRY